MLYWLKVTGKSESDECRVTLRKKIPYIYNCLKSAINYCAKNGGKDWKGLAKDILNVIRHCYGIHTHCRSYFCSKAKDNDTTHDYEVLKNNKEVFDAVQKIMINLAQNAEKLKDGLTTNIAESFFNMVAKQILGKRVNLCSRGSFTLRFLIAILLKNEGYKWAAPYFETFTKRKLGPVYEKYANQRNKQRVHAKNSALRPEAKARRNCPIKSSAEMSYGPNAQHLTTEALAQKKAEFQVIFPIIL